MSFDIEDLKTQKEHGLHLLKVLWIIALQNSFILKIEI